MKSVRAQRAPVVSLVSLGCAKNTVDSERLLGGLLQEGFLLAENPAEADLCLVNTCGFIADAREEVRAVLAGLRKAKARGRLRFLVALGCLVQRRAQTPEAEDALQDADVCVGFGDYPRLPAICRGLLAQGARTPDAVPAAAPDQTLSESFYRTPRLVTGSPHAVSLKISEGCSNGCRFCTIPAIRGPQVSRPMEDILQEARELIDGGAKEISLIAQDTTSYGRDRYGRRALPRLLRLLRDRLDAPVWFRLMYAYPRFLDDAVLEVLASDPRFCPYIDMPLQHIADPLLKAMGRGMTAAQTRAVLERLRARLPDVAIRTAFIVGYPGETDAHFEALRALVREGFFLHAGVFAYSREAGTPAGAAARQVPEAVKQQRREQLLLDQLEVSRRLLNDWKGREATVLIDAAIPRGSREVPRGARWVGRLPQQALEVDGSVYVVPAKGSGRPRRVQTGDFLRVRIDRALDYDLVATAAPCASAKSGSGSESRRRL